jgi:hypothetical protein
MNVGFIFFLKKHCSQSSFFKLSGRTGYLIRVKPMFWRVQYHGNFSIFTELLSSPKARSSDKLSFDKEVRVHDYFSCHLKSLSLERNFSDKTNLKSPIILFLLNDSYRLVISTSPFLHHVFDHFWTSDLFCGSLNPKLKSTRYKSSLMISVTLYSVL